jgi:hypothetical protein
MESWLTQGIIIKLIFIVSSGCKDWMQQSNHSQTFPYLLSWLLQETLGNNLLGRWDDVWGTRVERRGKPDHFCFESTEKTSDNFQPFLLACRPSSGPSSDPAQFSANVSRQLCTPSLLRPFLSPYGALQLQVAHCRIITCLALCLQVTLK